MMAVSHFVILSVLLAATAAELTTFSQCRGVSRDACSVSEVRISPCANKGRCRLLLGSNVTLSFDFTPNFSTSNMKTMVYSEGREFPGMGDDNACIYTTCPTISGTQQTFHYILHIGSVLPKGTFPITWKVWNIDNTEQVCCFGTTIRLVQAKKK